MCLILKLVFTVYVWAVVQCAHQVPWLPCRFTDEHVTRSDENHTETQLIRRQAMLQFGQKGDAPVNPDAITFLITGSKLDLRRYLEGVEADELQCELRRYSTAGIHVRWPVQEPHEFNRWFTCTFKHGKFTVTGFLRHPSDQAPSGQQDYHSWSTIMDREILTTTTTMVVKTLSPSVKASLGSQQRLHCQFALDHKGPNLHLEWFWQKRGERTKLFSHNSRTGETQGSGVVMKSLSGGDATYTLPFTKMSSEGTYVCSVSVNPLFVSLDISLHIEEAPRVSLNVGPTLSLQEGQEQKVICEAEGYFPLDVEMEWHEQDPATSGQRVGASLPKELQNVLLSSHKHNQDETYTLSAFFYLQASLGQSGRRFTCTVSHQSLKMPIKKSFILTVEEPSSWMFLLFVFVVMVLLLVVLCIMLPYLNSARKKASHKKPY